MRRHRYTLAVLTVAGTLLLAGCGAQSAGGQNPQPKPMAADLANPALVLQAESDKYLKQNKTLYIEPREVMERAVTAGDPAYYLVDIRNDEHYANAHIPGAVHIAYADAWREQKVEFLPRDKKIVVIDYSGHTASQVAALWGMLGFDAVAMKNGMAGWSQDKEVIGGSSLACEPLNYPVTAAPSVQSAFQLPGLDSKVKTLTELILSRSREATETAPVIQAKDFHDKKNSYFVLDIRQPDHYAAGHIDGAVNIPFRSVAEVDNLKRLPPDRNIVVVCYDGHASSQAARILNQLGYRATVLKDGMSIWTSDEKVIGAKPIACNVAEHPVMKLNATLKAGPSTAAT